MIVTKFFERKKFLAWLPSIFVKKTRMKLREQNNTKIPYNKLTYGDLINIISNKGLNLCNDLSMKQ